MPTEDKRSAFGVEVLVLPAMPTSSLRAASILSKCMFVSLAELAHRRSDARKSRSPSNAGASGYKLRNFQLKSGSRQHSSLPKKSLHNSALSCSVPAGWTSDANCIGHSSTQRNLNQSCPA
eukprot:1117730-Pyramimonas_sp.AAC.1